MDTDRRKNFIPYFLSLVSLVVYVSAVWSLSLMYNLQVFDNYAVTVMIGSEPYTLGLFDTAGELLVKIRNHSPSSCF